MCSLENEFACHRITLGLVEQYRKSKLPVSEFNLVKIAKEKGENGETIEGLEKAFGGFFQKPKESASDRLAEVWLSPQERAARQAVRIVKYVKEELGLEIHQIPPKLMPPIMEGIAYGYDDESIQSKWQKLLELSMAGKDIRAEYVRILERLDPFDARLLDYFYKHQKCKIDHVLEHAGITDSEIELNVSLNKIAEELKLCVVLNNGGGRNFKGDPVNSKNLLEDSGGYIKHCLIETNQNKRIHDRNQKYSVTIAFSPLGVGFMNCVTKELKPNPPSDTSSPSASN